MIALLSPSKAQQKLAEQIRERRLQLNFTQQGLAQRSGVPLATLRKFEQTGMISLESFLKLLMVLGLLESVVTATEISHISFSSLDEMIALNRKPKRKRGSRS